MKRGFTLVEMLIVVVVLSILMTMVFRLGSIGGDSKARSETISRMQRLENCLSGYYAAFGSYPPVKVHGSRDINLEVENEVQSDNKKEPDWNNSNRAWNQVKVACRAQPVACNFPFGDGYSDYIVSLSSEIQSIIQQEVDGYSRYWGNEETREKFMRGFDDGSTGPKTGGTSRFSGLQDKTDWRDIQLFRFGVMSFLLPRYMIMTTGYIGLYNQFAQWGDNNNKPHDPYTGASLSWNDVQKLAGFSPGGDPSVKESVKLSSVPSQAVTARWMPNLEGICRGNHSITLFGTTITDSYSYLDVNNAYILELYTPGGANGSGKQYALDFVTVLDGWGNEFYYYSPAPYQRYTLWSPGANGKTFPPWVPRETLNSTANKVVAEWIKDDITAMTN